MYTKTRLFFSQTTKVLILIGLAIFVACGCAYAMGFVSDEFILDRITKLQLELQQVWFSVQDITGVGVQELPAALPEVGGEGCH